MVHVVVLVLGDVGRSPRMQYHALSASKMPGVAKVSLVGYKGEKVLAEIRNRDPDRISVHHIPVWEWPALRKISILHALWKGVMLLVAIAWTLLSLPRYQLLLIQNPPSIPALIVSALLTLFNGSKILLDWHNLGFSIYEENLGKQHMLVRVSRSLEWSLSKFAHGHLCVSQALQAWLRANFGVTATVFYDRPPAIFQADLLTLPERHALLLKLGFTSAALFPTLSRPLPRPLSSSSAGTTVKEETIQTLSMDDESLVTVQDGQRTAIAISATSWTADEDFDLLLNALLDVESFLTGLDNGNLSHVDCGYDRMLCVITGKGEMKQAFEQKVSQLASEGRINRRVVVRTAWLEIQDYPRLMSCADLGISLHRSTSGLDLPMKVLDMFGSGVPVCAMDFPTISELVQHGQNGLVFSTKDQLSSQMISLFFKPSKMSSSTSKVTLQSLRERAKRIEHWEEHWNRVMAPVVRNFAIQSR